MICILQHGMGLAWWKHAHIQQTRAVTLAQRLSSMTTGLVNHQHSVLQQCSKLPIAEPCIGPWTTEQDQTHFVCHIELKTEGMKHSSNSFAFLCPNLPSEVASPLSEVDGDRDVAYKRDKYNDSNPGL